MGSFVSQPLEPVKDVAPPDVASSAAPPEVASSANPVPVIAPGGPAPPAEAPLFNNCWSCRVLSGSGLIGAGGYVYWVARKPMKLGYPPGPGTIAQMVFGISIACWGVVILSDPKGKGFRTG
ncbi:distal membrane-arm assembly complex protein 1 [Delphinapterus leucas]|uniref:Distal membrane-arm assembly complex protein 1 n=1 Tax=Delphinapterus leucas TaxID=9749 RepID=A0A2Y9ND70_DELLE|nr:distal membrane-arm assembly complex protein 1 [Delphinapterus leucas]